MNLGARIAVWNEVNEKLPDGYSKIEAIVGNGGQWFETEVLPHNGITCEIDFRFNEHRTLDRLLGCVDGNKRFYLFICYTGKYGISLWNGQVNAESYNIATDKERHIFKSVWANGIATILVDDEYITRISSSEQGNVDIRVFSADGSVTTWAARGAFYGLKIWENEVLVRDYIPCISDDTGIAEVYDKVNKRFAIRHGNFLIES